MNIDVNYIAVLVGAIVSMGIGFLWYSPILFAKPWVKLMGMSMEQMKSSQKQMGKYYALSMVLSLVTAYVLFHALFFSQNYFHNAGLTAGLITAFWSWLGFVMPTQATMVIFGGKKIDTEAWKLFGINTGYQLVSLLTMGVVLGLFR